MRAALESIARWAVMVTVVALGTCSVLAAKALHADGSYAMLGILTNSGYWDIDFARSFAMRITQTPVVLAIRLGERDVITLIYAFSLGLIGVPAVLWAGALALQWRSGLFWVLVAAFCATHLTSGFCSIGEYNTAYALTAFCFALMCRRRIGILSSAALVIAAVALTRAYESTAFLGPLLAVVALERAWRAAPGSSRMERVSLWAALVLFLLGAAIATRSILRPRDPGNLSNAAQFEWLLTNAHAMVILLVLGLFVVTATVPPRVRPWLVAVGVAACAAYALSVPLWNSPDRAYASRTLSGLVLCGLLAVEWYRSRRGEARDSPCPAPRVALAIAMFVALSVPAFVHTYRFGVWLKRYEQVAVTTTSWVPIDSTDAGRAGGYHWGWTSPSLSIVLRANIDGGLLNSPDYTGWDPFDPRTLADNPISRHRRERGLFGFGR